MIAARWDTPSAIWIDALPSHFRNQMVDVIAEGLEAHADWVIAQARAAAPRFEGDLARDLRRSSPQHHPGPWLSIIFGESGELGIGPPDWSGADPFSYPLAKQLGAKPHRVWLFVPGGDTKARMKLRRWAYQSGKWTREPATMAEYRQDQQEIAGGGGTPLPPPYIYVNPRARPFLYMFGHPYLNMVMEYIADNLQRVW